MVDAGGGADQASEPVSATSSQLSTPGDVQTSSTQQQPAKPAETGAPSESSLNTTTNLVSTNASNTL